MNRILFSIATALLVQILFVLFGVPLASVFIARVFYAPASDSTAIIILLGANFVLIALINYFLVWPLIAYFKSSTR